MTPLEYLGNIFSWTARPSIYLWRLVNGATGHPFYSYTSGVLHELGYAIRSKDSFEVGDTTIGKLCRTALVTSHIRQPLEQLMKEKDYKYAEY